MLSIITINFNNADGLKKTLDSVAQQTYKTLEYIIIDGGSTDGSVELIENYSEHINYWVSEKDRGIYHAMNKGLAVARGEYILFLNSGDYLCTKDVLASVLLNFQMDKDIIFGNILLERNGEIIREKTYPAKIKFKFFLDYESLPHPATFIKRTLFDRVGKYNEELRIIADWEFWLKAIFLYQATYVGIPVTVSVYSIEGISAQLENLEQINKERDIVYSKYFPGILEDYKEFEAFHTRIKTNFFVRVLVKLGLLQIA